VLLRRLRVLRIPRQIFFLLLFLLVLSFHNKSSSVSSESDAAYTADLSFFSFVMVCVRRVCGWNITACQCFVSNCCVLCRFVCFAEFLWFGKPKKIGFCPSGDLRIQLLISHKYVYTYMCIHVYIYIYVYIYTYM